MSDEASVLLAAYQAILGNVTGSMRAIYMLRHTEGGRHHITLTCVFRYVPTDRETELVREIAAEIKSIDLDVVDAKAVSVNGTDPLQAIDERFGDRLFIRAEEFEGPSITNAPY